MISRRKKNTIVAGISTHSKTTRNKLKNNIISVSFLLPALLLLAFFLVLPFLFAVTLSFTNQRSISHPKLPTEVVWFRNYIRLLNDSAFRKALFNNFYFALIVVPIQTSFALFLALLINQKLKGINLFRTIYFSPVITIMTVTAIIWTFLYNPQEGFINKVLSFLSFGLIKPINWLNDPTTAFPAIMILSIWQGVGFQMIIFLAGLQDIPAELYEAAKIDWASAWKQFPTLRSKPEKITGVLKLFFIVPFPEIDPDYRVIWFFSFLIEYPFVFS